MQLQFNYFTVKLEDIEKNYQFMIISEYSLIYYELPICCQKMPLIRKFALILEINVLKFVWL